MSEIDLHTHSTASDGTFSPTQLVDYALTRGLKGLALTDHDTTNGLEEALSAGKKQGLEVIPGCELSVEYPGLMHILGYWLKPEAPALNASLQELREKRNMRNELIIHKLQDLGIDITYNDVRNLAGDATVGRPHISRVLMDKGWVSSIQESFDRYLGSGGKAYVPKEKFGPEKAISVLKDEGALVVLAHPYSLELNREKLHRELLRLKEYGLDGVEVFYSEHSPEQMELYASLCRNLDLLPTGGSDFHGSVKPEIELGSGRGNLNLSYNLLQALKNKRQELGLWV